MELDYLTIFRGLNEAQVDYLLIESVAVNLYGIPRMTYDIDVTILPERENIIRLIKRLTKWGYKPRPPVDPYDLADENIRKSWVTAKNTKAFTFYNDSLPIAEIDILFDLPIAYQELRKRATYMNLKDIQIPVISIKDLIEIKRHTGRKQDLSDIRYLKMILNQGNE